MGALEAEVSAALWASDRPLTPSEIRDALGGDLAYTTVQTIVTRLWEKGRLDRQRVGRAYAYRPSVDEAEHFASRMHATLAEAKDRKAALSRFVDDLTPTELSLLREALEDGS
jgi:predicted transcriptional regulator